MSRNPGVRWLVVPVLLVLGACAAPTHRVHYSLLDEPRQEMPRKIVLLPADVQMFEISTGGVVEEVPAWSEQATNNIQASLDGSRARAQHFEVLDMPALSDEEQRLVDEHLALYDIVAGAALEHTRGSSSTYWQHKVDRFDYSLGDGLAFLASRTGAEAAVIAVGTCMVPSAQRKGTAVLLNIAGVGNMLTGTAYLCVGLVDLRTGDLLWVNDVGSVSGAMDHDSFKSRSDTKALVDLVTEPFPGLEEVDALRTKKGA